MSERSKKKQIQVTLSSVAYKQLDEMADRLLVSRTEIIRRALTEYFMKYYTEKR